MTPEQQAELQPEFDYGSIKPEHQAAAEEIAKFLAEHGQSELGELVKQRFKVKEIPMYDLTQSEFFNYCKEAGIYVAGQGYLVEGEGLNQMRYPMVAICDDIRRVEKIVEVIKNSVK
jgi:hypothetical protein